MDFKSFINEQEKHPSVLGALKKTPEIEKYIQSLQHVVERSGVTANERYFIGWKKDLPSHMVNDNFADGQYGSHKDAHKFGTKDAAEDAVARIKIKDGYNVYASPIKGRGTNPQMG